MFDLGNMGQALSITGSDYRLPEDWGNAAPAPSPGLSMPMNANDALAASGSSYRMPEAEPQKEQPAWLEGATSAADAAKSLPSSDGGVDPATGEKKKPGIAKSPLMGLVGTVAKVFSFL